MGAPGRDGMEPPQCVPGMPLCLFPDGHFHNAPPVSMEELSGFSLMSEKLLEALI